MKKILCICTGGVVRSVTIASILKYQFGHDALAASFEKNSGETLAMLMEWADLIVLVQEEKIGLISDDYREKVRLVPIPVDHWGQSNHPELVKVIHRLDLARCLGIHEPGWTDEQAIDAGRRAVGKRK